MSRKCTAPSCVSTEHAIYGKANVAVHAHEALMLRESKCMLAGVDALGCDSPRLALDGSTRPWQLSLS